MKLNFGFIGIIKPIIKKKTVRRPYRNKIEAIVSKDENGNIVAAIDMKNGYEIGDTRILPFTKESLDCKGKTDLWSKERDKSGHYVHITRSDSYFGHNEDYLPFKFGSKVYGYIVIVDNIKYFEVK